MEEYKKYEPIFGSWYISKLIGKGSFGQVFEITREEFGTTYRSALKILTIPQDRNDIKTRISEGSDERSVSAYYEDVLKEIVRENEIMAQLKGNSNIVSYEDHQIIPHDDGIGYDILIRMELLTPLIDILLERKLNEKEVVQLGIDMCKALELCHNKSIIHRDIKPQNIFVSENGDYKLGDFGIARTIEKTTGGMSRTGTYNYMAPEVLRGDHYNATVDIYSLGIVLYSLLNENRGPFLPLTGRVTLSDEEKARMKRFRGEPIPAPAHAGGRLSGIILKACAFYPEDRYQSARQLRYALEKYMDYGDEADVTVIEPNAHTPSNGVVITRPVSPVSKSVRNEPSPGYSGGRGKPRGGKSITIALAVLTAVFLVSVSSFLLYNLFSGDGDSDEENTAQTETSEEASEPGETHEPEEVSEPNASDAPESSENDENYSGDANQGNTAIEQQGYPIYNTYGYHTFFFDNNGGYGENDPIEVAVNTYFEMPTSVPYMEGNTFLGWYVQRLSDGKWYCKDLFKWIDWDGYSPAEGVPYLYEPGISLLYDDSWEKTGGSGDSNYVFHAVWAY